MKRILVFSSLGLLALALGCDQHVSRSDVKHQQSEVARLENQVENLQANRNEQVRESPAHTRSQTARQFDTKIEETKEALEAEQTQLAALEERQKVEAAMQEELDDMDQRIAQLEARAATADAEHEAQLRSQVAEFQARHDQLQKDLDQLRAASGSAWSQLKSSIEEAWQDATHDVNTAVEDNET